MATKLLKCIKALCRASGDTVHGRSLISSFVQGLNKAESVVPFLCFDEATSLPQFLCYPGSCQDNKSEIARGFLYSLVSFLFVNQCVTLATPMVYILCILALLHKGHCVLTTKLGCVPMVTVATILFRPALGG